MHYGDLFLGKATVLAKDTPAFIANRIGVFSIMALFHYTESADLSIDEIDKLTGPLIGRPKSATFRTSDLVGLDTLVHVANGLQHACPKDERRSVFQLPEFVQQMLAEGRLGSKTRCWFLQKDQRRERQAENPLTGFEDRHLWNSPKAEICHP